MIELLLEFVAELVFRALAELLGEVAGRLLSTRLGRLLVSAGVGFGAGWLWGAYLRADGHGGTPRTVGISAAFAVAGVAASFALRRAGVPADDGDGARVLPWHWPPHQWEAFALLNVFVALGVLVGFR